MVGFTIPTRALIALFCAAPSLVSSSLPTSRPIPHTTLKDSIRFHNFSPLATLALVALLPQKGDAIAIPEVFRPFPYTTQDLNKRAGKALGGRDWSSDGPDCTDTTESQQSNLTGTITGVEPVTVTVTVGLPNSTYTPSPATDSGHVTGTTSMNETASQGSTTPPTTTGTSSVPISTVNPVFASAQEAQRLNLGFQSLKTSDACTSGQRACIGNQIAQCSAPSPSSETPHWVTQDCLIGADPNQTPVCAAIPDFTANSTSTALGEIANATSTTSPVTLGCFDPTDITQAFNTAGVQGGMLPPGTQASGGLRLLAGKEVGGLGLGALLALIVTVLL